MTTRIETLESKVNLDTVHKSHLYPIEDKLDALDARCDEFERITPEPTSTPVGHFYPNTTGPSPVPSTTTTFPPPLHCNGT